MNAAVFATAAPLEPNLAPPLNKPEWQVHLNSDLVIITAVILVAGISIALWLSSRRARHLKRHSRPTDDGTSRGFSFSSRRRRKRKQQFQRNPTLAETGGLPPVKQKQSPSAGEPAS
jgi:hypothetical protein